MDYCAQKTKKHPAAELINAIELGKMFFHK